MTTDTSLARDLRRKIADLYLVDHPPPGAHRASWLTAALMRKPDDEEHHARARDFLAVVGLYRQLADALDATDDPQTGLVLDGLIGHATAELMGECRFIGWRAAALDVLDPDAHADHPLDRQDAVRLFALALGIEPDAAH